MAIWQMGYTSSATSRVFCYMFKRTDDTTTSVRRMPKHSVPRCVTIIILLRVSQNYF